VLERYDERMYNVSNFGELIVEEFVYGVAECEVAETTDMGF
jgi:hypothetical protein